MDHNRGKDNAPAATEIHSMKALYELVKSTLEEDYQFLSPVDSAAIFSDSNTGDAPVKVLTCRPSHFKEDTYNIDFIIVLIGKKKFLVSAKNNADEVIGCKIFSKRVGQSFMDSDVRAFIDTVINKHQNTDNPSSSSFASPAYVKEQSEHGKVNEVSIEQPRTTADTPYGRIETQSQPTGINDMPGFDDEYEVQHKLGGYGELHNNSGDKTTVGGERIPAPQNYGDQDLYPLGIKNVLNEQLAKPSLQLPDLSNRHRSPLSGSGFPGPLPPNAGGMAYDPLREMQNNDENQRRPDGSNYPGIRYEDPFGRGSSNGNAPPGQGPFGTYGNGFM